MIAIDLMAIFMVVAGSATGVFAWGRNRREKQKVAKLDVAHANTHAVSASRLQALERARARDEHYQRSVEHQQAEKKLASLTQSWRDQITAYANVVIPLKHEVVFRRVPTPPSSLLANQVEQAQKVVQVSEEVISDYRIKTKRQWLLDLALAPSEVSEPTPPMIMALTAHLRYHPDDRSLLRERWGPIIDTIKPSRSPNVRVEFPPPLRALPADPQRGH